MTVKLRRADVRLLIGALFAIAMCISVGLLLRQLPWATYWGTKWWSTTMQLVGTLVTGFGLLYAWARATRFWSRTWPRIERLLARLFEWPQHQVVRPGGAAMGLFGWEPSVFVGLGLDRTLTVEDQLTQIERYINTNLAQEFKSVSVSLGRLRRELEQAKAQSEQAIAEAEAKAQKAIRDLESRLDATQALDLSWAIGGLFVTAAGTFLSYWA